MTTIRQVEHVVLGDGRNVLRVVVRVGEKDMVVETDASPAGTGRMKHLQMAVDKAIAREQVNLLRAKQRLVEKMVDARVGNKATPPMFAELMISLLAPKNTAQALLGDMEEMFSKNVCLYGRASARSKYWMQVVNSVAPLLWQWIKRMGFVTMLVDYFRTKFGL